MTTGDFIDNADGAPAMHLFSESELALLDEIAGKYRLDRVSLVSLLDLERRMEHMGRRHGIHQQIKATLTEVAKTRLETTDA